VSEWFRSAGIGRRKGWVVRIAAASEEGASWCGGGQMPMARIDSNTERERYYEGAVGLETERVVGGVGARQGDCTVASWRSGAGAKVFAAAKNGG
jgi:hypothetical protein